ncbi:MAG: AAA family ATPase [Gammaproteobacteria bacterium]|nr:AAA family ATPase [Gammaproteobacteria bacterium]
MLDIPGYEIHTKLCESVNSIVYRGCRLADKQPLIFKMPKEDYPAPGKLQRYQHEYEILRHLDIAGVAKTYGLEKYKNTLVILVEDIDGKSLGQLIKTHGFGLAEFLPLAIRIAEILGEIHAADIIHKDINPSNIIFNPDSGQLKIIDFSIASKLPRENPTLKNPDLLEGTLAYISPEQTGRMNRSLDCRTDFYALGGTFYRLLTRHFPFQATDSMELVHCHLAKQFIPAHRLDAQIPRMISAIISKLLEKTAEARYQSAWGIKTDLEICLEQFRSSGKITEFPLARQDCSERFHLPQKTYGREQETASLQAAVERVSRGQNEVMLVAGYSGVGKSAIIREIYKSITEKRGYFIAGKFDALKRNVPYSAIIEAFQDLLRQLLTESPACLAVWKEKLLAALQSNARVIIDVIPEVELIIGAQASVPELEAVAAQNRLHAVFQDFVRVFCRPGHPLVIFLDSLQWANTGSLNLLTLLSSMDCPSLLLIGAYRDNEVQAAHPLLLTMEKIKNSGAAVNSIFLAPIGLSEVKQFIADTLNSTLEEVSSLAELVLEKTHGNPFFMGEFLKSLYTEELLTFVSPSVSRADKERKKIGWHWDLSRIRKRDITDNVVKLMAGKVQKLSETTRNVLKRAACIGNQFELRTLAIIYEKTPEETAADLSEALVEGLVLPLSDIGYRLWTNNNAGERAADDAPLTIEYRFAHSQIQQAVYSLIPPDRKHVLHWQLGQLLLWNTAPEELEQQGFAIVNHLNMGTQLIKYQSERDELAALNLLVGRKAKISGAYGPAFNYLQAGVDLLDKNSWQMQYDLTLALYTEATETAYLGARFKEQKKLAGDILRYARTLLDKVKVYEITIQAFIAQNKLLKALDTARLALKGLGVRWPAKPGNIDIMMGLMRTKFALRGKEIEAVAALPEMRDPDKLAAMRILSTVSPAAYSAAPRLFPLIAFTQVRLSIKHGNTEESAYAYAVYSLMLYTVLDDIKSGCRMSEVALRLLDRYDAGAVKAKTYMVIGYTCHWSGHVKESLLFLKDAYQNCMDAGVANFAAYSAYIYAHYAYFQGRQLAELEKEISAYSKVIAQEKQETGLFLINVYRQAILNLLGQAEHPCRLLGEACDEEQTLPAHLASNDRTAIFSIYINKLMLCYLFHEYQYAVEHAENAEKYLDGVPGAAAVPMFYFYDSLARLANFHNAAKGVQKQILGKVAANRKKMQKWAQYAPMNYAHKLHLIEAEQARVLGEDESARQNYEKAIGEARNNGYLNEQALASELTAKFYLARRQNRQASQHLRNARDIYEQWGALAKVRHLETRYAQVLAENEAKTESQTKSAAAATGHTHTTSGDLDMTSIIKTSQTIAEEIVLDRLLAKLMKIVMENAGAQHGILLLDRKGQWLIEAEAVADKEELTVLQSIAVDLNASAADKGAKLLPLTLVNYVARTRKNVVLEDAAWEGAYTHDPYIVAYRPKSVSCMPLMNKGKLTGMLYLENNLTTRAFTPQRLSTLGLLSTQIAISLENALYYAQLEQARNTAEEEHAKAEQACRIAEHANRAKSTFLAKMSHELRTPLNAILGYCELIGETGEDLGEDLNYEEIQPDLEHIQTAGKHLLGILSDILDISKIEADKLEFNLSEFAVTEMVNEAVTTIRPLMDNRDNLLTVACSKDLGMFYGDRQKLRQILLNLLNNAAKFTDKGTVTLKASRRFAPHEAPGVEDGRDWLYFEIADTGIGIAPEQMDKLFNAFRQADNSSTRGYEGVGLGLAISEHFCRSMGGRIEVDSEPGKGSTFTVRLPASEAACWLPNNSPK